MDFWKKAFLSRLLFLMLSSYIGIPMWLISLGLFLTLCVSVLVMRYLKREKPVILLCTLKRMPWELVPFMLSMFVLVVSLRAGTKKLFLKVHLAVQWILTNILMTQKLDLAIRLLTISRKK